MALPLFNRKGSPDHTRNVLTWFGCWPPPETDIIPFQGFDHFDESPVTSAASSRPQSISLNSDCYFDHNTEHCFGEDAGYGNSNNNISQPGLLDEISDDHIPQPSFISRSTCPFPDCKSTAIFTTGRDFRRHYRQHFKRFFCRYPECPQSTSDAREAGKKGFATRKDRARHEAKHNPAIRCKWRAPNGEQCSRTFSRMDNMRDHYRRIHKK